MQGEVLPTGVVNVEQAAAWAGEGDHWARYDARYNASVAGHTAHLLAAADIDPGDRVLDVGCGCGDTTRQAARLAAPQGAALGVDLSARMVERARQISDAEALANVSFELVDAQVHHFQPGSCDVAISRFGASFFADLVAAFAKVGRALRPGGRLAVLAWQEISSNEWLVTLRGALAAGRVLPAPPADQPGPFALADRGRAAAVLTAAGFADLSCQAVDEPVHLGSDGEDAFGFVSGIGMTRGLLHGLEPAAAAAALESLRVVLHAADTGHGVFLGSAAWLLTATRP